MARFTTEPLNPVSLAQRFHRSNVITTDCSWTVPAGVGCVSFELWGAGGSGGARCCCDCYHQGAGGAPGGYSAMTIPTTPGNTYSIVVGRNSYRDSYGATHPLCCGDGGTCTCVTGTGISCLNAGCGMAGNNNCYQYCNCAACCYGCAASYTTGATASATAFSSVRDSGSLHNWTSAGGMTESSSRRAGGYIGTATDSQAWGQTYVTSAGGSAFRHGNFEQSLNCSTHYFNFSSVSTPVDLWFGSAGVGTISETCCTCAYAPTGQHGVVIIRY